MRKVNLFRIVLLTLFVATIFWGALFYKSSQDHRGYVEDYYEKWLAEKQRLEEGSGIENGFIDPIFLPLSYWEWNSGGLMLITGFVLLCAWILAAGEKLLESRKTS